MRPPAGEGGAARHDPVDARIEAAEGGYRAAFELPSGSYATVVLGELTHGEAPELDESAG